MVITDGYLGDYKCWEKALKQGMVIGTLEDIEELPRNPKRAFQTMKKRAGLPAKNRGKRHFLNPNRTFKAPKRTARKLAGQRREQRLPDRSLEICGWTLRLVDGTQDRSHKC